MCVCVGVGVGVSVCVCACGCVGVCARTFVQVAKASAYYGWVQIICTDIAKKKLCDSAVIRPGA